MSHGDVSTCNTTWLFHSFPRADKITSPLTKVNDGYGHPEASSFRENVEFPELQLRYSNRSQLQRRKVKKRFQGY